MTSAQAVYDAAAPRYVEFVGTEISSVTEGPVDQSFLLAFSDLVMAEPVRRVADVGCGTGRAAAFLAAAGLEVVGMDVSAAMVEVARTAHPQIAFVEGRLDGLPIRSQALAGVVSWYSIIYTPPTLLGETFAELARVLRPGGFLLLAFQTGEGEELHREDAFGTGLPLASYRHSVGETSRRLGEAGLQVHMHAQREAELGHETSPQAFVIARPE